jgi:hypothetical protein
MRFAFDPEKFRRSRETLDIVREDPATAKKCAFETHSHDHMVYGVKRSAHGIIAVRDDEAIDKKIP